MSKKCPKCHFENTDDSKFCEKCSSLLLYQDMPESDEKTKTLKDKIDRDSKFESKPEKIGHYKILDVIGSGGMGTVYLAQQEKPIRRKVAIKVIKPGLDSNEIIARFESEQQALALMNHPNVAQVYDSGQTERGYPYFVMEYVPGTPITTYCDKYEMTTQERLILFQRVCEAVQHAHFRGIVHRDLKPSNILVTFQDEKHIPKVIDFGIAKALTGQGLTEKTIHTQHGFAVGTPSYMSPEQAELTRYDIDTRTDIYSLGVVLYELLVGVAPFDRATLQKAGLGEILRIIREEEPPRLGNRLSRLGDTSTEIAQKRRTELASLRRELEGDLEWITMKAMEKNRSRRYATVSEFAADMARYVKREPIVARPPSFSYRMKKFVSRHKLGVAFSTVLLAVLLSFGAIMAVQAGRIVKESTVSVQIADFLVDMFEESDPKKTQGESMTVREILEQGAEKIERELSEQPQIKSRLMNILGNVYKSLAIYDRAAPLLEKALELRENEYGDNHIFVAESLHDLAMVYRLRAGEGGDRVIPLLERSLKIREKRLGSNHPDVAECLLSLAREYDYARQRDMQEELIRRAINIYENRFGPDDLETARALYELARLLLFKAEYEEADSLFKRILEIRENKLGPDNTEVANVLSFIALSHNRKGEIAEAEAINKRILDIHEKVYGPEHPVFAGSLSSLAWFYAEQGKHELADEFFERSLAIEKKSLGPDHPDVAASLNNFAFLYKTLFLFDKAEGYYKRANAIREKIFGPDDPAIVDSLTALGDLYQMQKKYDLAESIYRRGLAIREKALSPDHPEVASSLSLLVSILRDQRRYDQAEPLLIRQLEILEKQPGADGSNYRLTRELGFALGSASGFYYELGDLIQADDMLRRCLTLLEKAFGRDHLYPVQYVCRSMAIEQASRSGNDIAERIFKLALSFFEKSGGPEDKRVGVSHYYLGEFYTSIEKYEEAEDILQQALKNLEGDSLYEGLVLFSLAYLNREQEKYDVAEPLYQKAILILEESQGPSHRDTLAAKKEYAELLHKTGRLEEAEKIEGQIKSSEEK